ncbi:TPA: hypothetical protein ACGEYH_001576 [Providencia rettgeri]|uniref:hypothetical protein n=1 Tax=unclassified Providencia TaxID=2633465 RepID=UPI00234BE9D5|nr:MULTISPECIES: hypothetical protein [unclassified Providencia]WOB99321.1 hypothetical protein P3L55_18995 [Providencia sp. PROV046]
MYTGDLIVSGEKTDEIRFGLTLSDKIVSICTLVESVAQRVKKQLLVDYSQADIRLNNCNGYSTMLRLLAK